MKKRSKAKKKKFGKDPSSLPTLRPTAPTDDSPNDVFVSVYEQDNMFHIVNQDSGMALQVPENACGSDGDDWSKAEASLFLEAQEYKPGELSQLFFWDEGRDAQQKISSAACGNLHKLEVRSTLDCSEPLLAIEANSLELRWVDLKDDGGIYAEISGNPSCDEKVLTIVDGSKLSFQTYTSALNQVWQLVSTIEYLHGSALIYFLSHIDTTQHHRRKEIRMQCVHQYPAKIILGNHLICFARNPKMTKLTLMTLIQTLIFKTFVSAVLGKNTRAVQSPIHQSLKL